MRAGLKLFSIILTALTASLTARAQQNPPTPPPAIPNQQVMQSLNPSRQGRLRVFDRLFPQAGALADEAQARYSDPQRLADVQVRLQRMRESGNPADFFTPTEQIQLKENLEKLKVLDAGFFEQMVLKAPMSAAIQTQKAVTLTASPAPRGKKREALINFWQETRAKSPLYGAFEQALPFATAHDPDPSMRVENWRTLLFRFNHNPEFREKWIQQHPETLPQLRTMTEIWAWDDPTVRKVTIHNENTPQEYWVLERVPPTEGIPSRFEALASQDFNRLMEIEFASTLFFNRLTLITLEDGNPVYHLVPVEKGRSMEAMDHRDERGSDKRTFLGAELVRASKADEFLQRLLVRLGKLNLFVGLRTMPIHEARRLMKAYPELMLATGQLGFSVTGGTAQTASNRTDGVEQQAPKLVATLIDAIDLANVKDIKTWFRDNVKHVLRTIFGGVGAGGSKPLAEPGRAKIATDKKEKPRKIYGVNSCEGYWVQ